MRIASPVLCSLLILFHATTCGGDEEHTGTGAEAAAAPDTAGVPDATALEDTGMEDAAAADTAIERDTRPESEAMDERTPLRVLFVGNSYTAVNNLPAVVEQLVEHTRPGVDLSYEAINPGGASLSDHYFNADTRDRIASGDFDVVVIQGQSTEPLRPAGFAVTADRLGEEARKAGARVVFFATWARAPGSAYYEEQAFGGYNTPELMANALDRSYSRPNAMTARVGAAFQLALTELPDVELYLPDGSHPSRAGTLLAAAVVGQIVAGVTSELPDPPPLEVPAGDAERLFALVPRVACYGSFAFCAGACVWLGSDRSHCGGCGVQCADHEPCTAGECGCPNPDQTACARRCVYLPLDHNHCGACGNACEGGRRCFDGQCACLVHQERFVSMADLTARQPQCVTGEDDYHPSCDEAVHAVCAELDCFVSGFGPQMPATFNPEPPVTCVSGEVVATSWPALGELEPACGPEARGEQACATAIHRFCAAAGAVSGFGPVAVDGDDLEVTCLRRASLVEATWADLAAKLWQCNGDDVRWGLQCDFAAMRLCRDSGHSGGFGPVGVDGDAVTVVCVHD